MQKAINRKHALFLELGVFKATSINICANELPNQQFFGFDSFEGLQQKPTGQIQGSV